MICVQYDGDDETYTLMLQISTK